MSLGSEIQAAAAEFYASGMDPFDFAEFLVSETISDSAALGDCSEIWDIIARRILGLLLDAGWTPPERPA